VWSVVSCPAQEKHSVVVEKDRIAGSGTWLSIMEIKPMETGLVTAAKGEGNIMAILGRAERGRSRRSCRKQAGGGHHLLIP